tara:strand:+ start:305 stop:1237 length:933 start_codon:yes stop_codon:yes gene_type:complete
MSYTRTTLRQAIKDYTENDETSFVNNLDNFIRASEDRIQKNVQLSLFRKNVTANTTASNQFLSMPTDFLAPFSLSLMTPLNPGGIKFFLEFKDTSFIQTYTPNSTTVGSPRYYATFDVSNFILAPTPNAAFEAQLHYFYRPLSLTASTVTLFVNPASASFVVGDSITGQTSGVTAKVTSVTAVSSGGQTYNQLTVSEFSGLFTFGETVSAVSTVNGGSGATGPLLNLTAGGTSYLWQSADTTTSWLSINASTTLLYGALIEAYIYMKGENDVLTMFNQRFNEALVGVKMLGEAQATTDEYRTGQVIRERT